LQSNSKFLENYVLFRELAVPGVRMSARGILAIILKKFVDGKVWQVLKRVLEDKYEYEYVRGWQNLKSLM
jgi:hypothetical protein